MTTIELFHKITGALGDENKQAKNAAAAMCIDSVLVGISPSHGFAIALYQFCKEQQLGHEVLFELREYFADVHDIILESEV